MVHPRRAHTERAAGRAGSCSGHVRERAGVTVQTRGIAAHCCPPRQRGALSHPGLPGNRRKRCRRETRGRETQEAAASVPWLHGTSRRLQVDRAPSRVTTAKQGSVTAQTSDGHHPHYPCKELSMRCVLGLHRWAAGSVKAASPQTRLCGHDIKTATLSLRGRNPSAPL